MSDIDSTANIPPQSGEGATRVTRASTTSDDSSAQQQSTDQKASQSKKTPPAPEKAPGHETAVTISASLSNLEVGSRIAAEYVGIDGENRPLITSESGTYVVKYDPAYQADIDKIRQGATLEVRILKLEREIEARLVFHDPAGAKSTSLPLSVPVTLELTGLASLPPQVRGPVDRSHLPLEQQEISYRATDIYRAENIARESASKLAELPLTSLSTNHTLFERAVPAPNRPVVIQPGIAGNALVAQENIIKPPAASLDKSVATGVNIEKLLHLDIQASVIKNIPVAGINLPEIVRKNLGTIGPLEGLKAGVDFTLRIESIAVSDAQAGPSQQGAGPPHLGIGQGDAGVSVPASPPELSGIIIAPGKELQTASPQRASRENDRYPDRYQPRGFSVSGSKEPVAATLYVATPTAVIKFQSPIPLAPGTIISFSLPDKTEAAGATGVKGDSTPPQDAPATGWIATSPVTQQGSPVTPAQSPQPLENFPRNWESLSQIIAAVPVGEGSGISQSLNNRIPGVQNPGQMTSGMVFFLAAMGAKNPARIWLGPQVTQQLEKAGQGRLLNLLDNDMQRIFRLGADTPVNEWRPALIPLHVGGDVTAIPLLSRQISDEEANDHNDDETDEEKTAATRFIVELDLSQFGLLQVDGLLKEKKLNIIIRSQIILPSEMKQRLSGMFLTALEVSGYNGDLKFRDNVRPEISVRNIVNQKIHMFRA